MSGFQILSCKSLSMNARYLDLFMILTTSFRLDINDLSTILHQMRTVPEYWTLIFDAKI